jgi:hypothetical protein
MNVQPDFEELLRLLEDNQVDYLIVGGYAVAFHGHPRFTKDLDIFYSVSEANIENLFKALLGFGFTSKDLDSAVFAKPGNIITFGVEPLRVDFINQIDGVTFEQAKSGGIRGAYGAVSTRFIGREDLLKNKANTPRSRDKTDLEALQ